jgi:hypothetical protein
MISTTPADGRAAEVARRLLAAPGVARYPELFPRLFDRHLAYLADPLKTPPATAAALLTGAGRQAPTDPADAAQVYRKRGELPALRAVADAELVARAAAEWQRDLDEKLGLVEGRAALCDREGVRCADDLTWGKRVLRLRDQLSGEHAESPASQRELIEACQAEMDKALKDEKQLLKDRLAAAAADLERRREELDAETVRRAGEFAESADKLIDADDLVVGLRKLAALESMLCGRIVRGGGSSGQRLPLPTRRNPLGRVSFHFEHLLAVARRGSADIDRRGLRAYLPDDDSVAEAIDPKELVVRHAARQSATRRIDWTAYFAALRDWLGEARRQSGRRLQRLDMRNLETHRADLPGRWAFMTAEPWQGAPFYEDMSGRPRIIAVMRLTVADEDAGRTPLIIKYASQALRELLQGLPAKTDDELRFQRDGLVIVLLPGETLTGKKYDQFRLQVQLERAARAVGRIAYLDDLDLLRILPVPADDRFRALLEVALPRFPDALSQTYQESDAVRPRMFFGRSDELAKLVNGTTVVFSGRKMGKSSLLHRLRAQCGPDTDQRAILVGCSGVAPNRSWTLLHEIERELTGLLARERDGQPGVSPPRYGPAENFAKALAEAKERFHLALDEAMQELAARNVQRLYVLLDEADNFIRAEMEETSGGKEPRSAVSWFLRDLQTGTYAGRLRFIFAGYDQLGRVYRDPGLGHSAFGNWGMAGPLKLGPLDDPAARALVLSPLTALGMLVGDDLAERILDYTSGHASLIQALCRKLAERVREKPQTAWPLEDVAVEFEDVLAVAEDQRAAGDQSYRQLLEQTLGLNLDIARAYPLKLLFLALVSPTGLGSGRRLGTDPLTVEDALEQVRSAGGEPPDDLTPTLVLDSLDLLAQLGLLEDVSDTSGRAFRFKARHYVNVLRTKNGFQGQLRQAADEWARAGRRAPQAEPRYVWTLPDSELRALRDSTPRPAVVFGLPGSGRGYLTEVLTAPYRDGARPVVLAGEDPELGTRLEALMKTPPAAPVLVADPGDRTPWAALAGWLRRAGEAGVPLRWVGGPGLAWELANDPDLALLIGGLYGLGPLTPAEIEPWTARELGGSEAPTGATVPDQDRQPLLELTGGLLPVLELFRKWLTEAHGHFPDVLRAGEVERYRAHLEANPAAAARTAERLTRGIPVEVRVALHHLFTQAREWGIDSVSRADVTTVCPYLDTLGDGGLPRFLDAATWLHLLPSGGPVGQVRVPHESVFGLLVRTPGFAAP